MVTRSILSQFKKLNFDNCWCFDMFYYPTFLYTKISVRISLICGCHWSWHILFWIIRKMDGVEEPLSLDFVTWMKLLSLWLNLAWKLAYKLVMNWFSKERKGTSCHTMSQKDQMFWRKYTFGILKFKFQTDLNKLKKKTSSFRAFLRQTGL